MRNLLQSIVLMLAGVGVYFVIQILFFPQTAPQETEVADLTRELSDIKQVIARISEDSAQISPPVTVPATAAPIPQRKPQVVTKPLASGSATAKPKARPTIESRKTALNTPSEAPKTSNPFDDDTSKAQLLAAIVRAVKAQTEDSIAPPITPQGVGVEVRVVQGTGDSVSHYFYTIQKGDSLRSIARNFYGDPTQYPRIYEANKRLLPNPDRIQVGQRLRIPPKA